MTGLLIPGMHRSGTSALTRLLNLLGASLDAEVLPPTASNERGFWEPREVVEIHNAVFDRLDSSWDCVWKLPDGWHIDSGLSEERRRLEEVFQRDFQSSLWVLKDPRVCRLFPLWRDLLESHGVDFGCVHILRHPGEVAASLEKRKKLCTEQSLLLWLRYVLESEMHTRNCNRTVTTYDGLMADWRVTVAQLADSLGIEWPNSIDSVGDEVDAFLSPDLRHYSVEDRDRIASMPEPLRGMVTRVWDALSQVVDKPTQSVIEVLDDVRSQLDGLSDSFRPVQQSVDAARRRLAKHLQVETDRLQNTHADELSRQQAHWVAQLAQCEAEHRNEIEQLIAAHRDDLIRRDAVSQDDYRAFRKN